MGINQLNIIVLLATGMLLLGCNHLLDVEPEGLARVESSEALETKEDVEAALLGVYSGLQSNDYYGQAFVILPEVLAGKLSVNTAAAGQAWADIADNTSTQPSNLVVKAVWDQIYTVINRADRIMAKAPSIDNTGPLVAQARALRALAYFDLMRLFAVIPTSGNGSDTRELGVPVIKGIVNQVGEVREQTRMGNGDVYDMIITELEAAKSDLSQEQTPGKVNYYTCEALLSRIYLYRGNYEDAVIAAENALAGPYALADDYSEIFEYAFSGETIFELAFSPNDVNGLATALFDPSQGADGLFRPSPFFNQEDSRISYYFQGLSYVHKYTNVQSRDDNVPVIREAEVYLNLAEADVKLNDNITNKAKDHLRVVMSRAYQIDSAFQETGSSTVDEFLQQVYYEREAELFCEGHHHFDVVRNNTSTEPGDIRLFNVLPIPAREIQLNPGMQQNDGY